MTVTSTRMQVVFAITTYLAVHVVDITWSRIYKLIVLLISQTWLFQRGMDPLRTRMQRLEPLSPSFRCSRSSND
jgi:hypothetical protein